MVMPGMTPLLLDVFACLGAIMQALQGWCLQSSSAQQCTKPSQTLLSQPTSSDAHNICLATCKSIHNTIGISATAPAQSILSHTQPYTGPGPTPSTLTADRSLMSPPNLQHCRTIPQQPYINLHVQARRQRNLGRAGSLPRSQARQLPILLYTPGLTRSTPAACASSTMQGRQALQHITRAHGAPASILS